MNRPRAKFLQRESLKRYANTEKGREARRRAQRVREAIKRGATPKWADLSAIQQFYKFCPKGYEVDHIIPINGKMVCGLHILENLQYLPAQENLRKSNKVIPETLEANVCLVML